VELFGQRGRIQNVLTRLEVGCRIGQIEAWNGVVEEVGWVGRSDLHIEFGSDISEVVHQVYGLIGLFPIFAQMDLHLLKVYSCISPRHLVFMPSD
jgi:hypothetical protein